MRQKGHRIDPESNTKLKIIAAHENKSMKEILENCIEEKYKEVIKTIKK